MTIIYLDEIYEFKNGEFKYLDDHNALWVKINWENTIGAEKIFGITIQSKISKSTIFDGQKFLCANDCDKEWDKRHVIGAYDGVHSNLYNGEYVIVLLNKIRVRVTGFGYMADGILDFRKNGGYRIEFDESFEFA